MKSYFFQGLGMDEPIGHLDFYPNGGDNQPGCGEGMMKFIKQQNQSMFHGKSYFTPTATIVPSLNKKFVTGVRKFLSCDHVRSHEFLLESIDSSKCTFLSIQCNSWEEFLAGDCFPCKSEEVSIPIFLIYIPAIQNYHRKNYLYFPQNPNGNFCANMGLPSINEWRDSEFSKSASIKLYTITKNDIPFCGNFR